MKILHAGTAGRRDVPDPDPQQLRGGVHTSVDDTPVSEPWGRDRLKCHCLTVTGGGVTHFGAPVAKILVSWPKPKPLAELRTSDPKKRSTYCGSRHERQEGFVTFNVHLHAVLTCR